MGTHASFGEKLDPSDLLETLMATIDGVDVERRDRVLWITLDRIERRNALDAPAAARLQAAMAELKSDRSLLAGVLTGAGDKAFCAGADLAAGSVDLKPDLSEPTAPYANLLRSMYAVPVPLIARVNGACLAGGIGLVALCDMAIAADHARFGAPEVKVGLFAMQVYSALQHIVPPKLLFDMCATGDAIDAPTALAAGLVNRVVPFAELDAATDALLQRVVDKSPLAMRRGKHAIRSVSHMDFSDSLAFMEAQIALLASSDDAREGLSAFREKRPPQWTGR